MGDAGWWLGPLQALSHGPLSHGQGFLSQGGLRWFRDQK